jgi:hypothetical protein
MMAIDALSLSLLLTRFNCRNAMDTEGLFTTPGSQPELGAIFCALLFAILAFF